MIHKIFKTPVNSFTNGTIFHLDAIGGPKIRSVKNMSWAARYRLHQSLDFSASLYNSLYAHHESFPLLNFAENKYGPQCWQWEPFIVQLREHSRIVERVPGVNEALQSRQPASGIQKAVSPTLLNHLYPSDLITHIIKRVGLQSDFFFFS